MSRIERTRPRMKQVGSSLDEEHVAEVIAMSRTLRWSFAQTLREAIVRGIPSLRREITPSRISTVGEREHPELR